MEILTVCRQLRKIWSLKRETGLSFLECLDLLGRELQTIRELDELYEMRQHTRYPEWVYKE